MLAFTQYSPAVLSLLVDRDKYKPLIVTNASALSLRKLTEFLNGSEIRARVLMFSSVDTFLDILEEGFNLQTSKIVLVDNITSLVKVTDNVRDIRRRGSSYEFLSITPSELNEALAECAPGPELKIAEALNLEDVTFKTKVVQRNLNNEAELNVLIQEAVQDLGNKEKAEAAESLLKFVAGISSKKKFGGTCRTFSIPAETAKKLVDYTASYKGKALRVAFMDATLFKTDPNTALQEAKANKLDFDYLTTLLPTDVLYEFEVKTPKTLERRRSIEQPLLVEEKDEPDEQN